jgi:Ca-activated chloride channel family protein
MWPWLVASAWSWSALAGMPLRSIDYDVQVDGPLAEVRIEQVFVNDSDEFIEAIYAFPLHEQAAVDGMRIIVGEHLVEGEVLELEQAQVEYTEAVAEGFVAALTTQQRPNVFTQQVGNIPPGEEVRVELRVIQPVPHVDGAYELVLPLVVAPRFFSPEAWAKPSSDVLFGSPPVSIEGTEATAGIDVEVHSGLPFEYMLSPSHELAITELSEGARAVTGRVRLDRDYVLRWSVSAERPLATLHVQEGHALLTMEPPAAPPRQHVVARELIFVIDQSCSMAGQPIELVRQAMLEALEHVDARDSLRILRFNDKLAGDKRSQPATPQVLHRARQQIRALDTSGGTYMLEGVLEALDTKPDPVRERNVIFLTDALIGEDKPVLRAIADRVGKARLFAFGVGESPNRWLLEEMASFGGGRTSWLREGEPPEEAVQRFVDTISEPVLSDIEVDWGDWVVEQPWPRRLPALYAGQPLTITARVLQPGSSEVVIRGRLGDGRYETRLSSLDAGTGRAIPSTWARSKIAQLERDLLWGEVPEPRDEIVQTSLAYQVLSQYTAFLAVDRGRLVNPRGGPQPVEQPVEQPAGMQLYGHGEATEEITVEARQMAIDTESTAVGQVMSKEFLQRVPAGRTYQSAVQTVPGVAGNPNMGGAASHENTYLVDGANITDPVTGTFSLNFNFDAIQQIEVLTAGRMPELPGSSGAVINLVTASGTNNLEGRVRADQMTRLGPGDPLHAERVSGLLSGPLVRDRLWVLGSYGFDRSSLLEETPRGFLGHTGFLKLTLQPSPEHRFTASGAAETTQIALGDSTSPQDTALGTGRWQWFLAPQANVDTSVTGQTQDVGGDLRTRLQGRMHLSVLSVDDPLGGTHDLKVGSDFERVGWALEGDWVGQWLGVEPPSAASLLRSGVFAQDSYKPVRNLTIAGGARLDLALGQAHLGPRLYAAWDPWSDQRTKLIAGFGRVFGHLDLPTAVIEPERGLTQLDEWLGQVEREVVDDVALGVEGTVRMRAELPVQGGGRTEQGTWETRLFLRKIEARRWMALLSWRYSKLIEDGTDLSTVTWVDGSLIGFTHALDGTLYWDLPTDPWTSTIGLVGGWYAQPLGTLAPDPSSGALPNAPRWSGGVRLAQVFALRKGHLTLDAELLYLALLEDGRDLSSWRWVQAPLLQQEGWEGPRLQVGLQYGF